MPARRRRVLSRTSADRFMMWDAKVRGDVYAVQLEAVKPLARPRVAAYQAVHEQLISLVKEVLTGLRIDVSLVQEYMWYAEKLWKLTQTYRDRALQLEADAVFLWYLARGRNEAALRAIAQLLGIKLSSLEDLFERLGVPAMLRTVAKGTIVTDGTEQKILEYVGLAVIQGYVDLSSLSSGDEVVIRTYVKLREDGEFKLYNEDSYQGPMPEPALYVHPRLSAYAQRITVQQIKGAPRSLDYFFARGG